VKQQTIRLSELARYNVKPSNREGFKYGHSDQCKMKPPKNFIKFLIGVASTMVLFSSAHAETVEWNCQGEMSQNKYAGLTESYVERMLIDEGNKKITVYSRSISWWPNSDGVLKEKHSVYERKFDIIEKKDPFILALLDQKSILYTSEMFSFSKDKEWNKDENIGVALNGSLLLFDTFSGKLAGGGVSGYAQKYEGEISISALSSKATGSCFQ